MIDFVFTLDYEIYGNGQGSLQEMVYEPAHALAALFRAWDARYVAFIEAAELEKIETCASDRAIDTIKAQVKDLFRNGFEIGLHLHPQWCNAHYEQGKWVLDEREYNLCTLPKPRIEAIVRNSIQYLRHLVGQPTFNPLSFRAGNWLLQPTQPAASVLADNGIKIDSSVFKGGRQHSNALDYRRAVRNGYFWSFAADVNEPDPAGLLMELPIFTEMVPIWKMVTEKRVKAGNGFSSDQNIRRKLNRVRDFMRMHYPLKLDFCRMTLDELTSTMTKIIARDQETPTLYKPIVAIGHTKDLSEIKTVENFLSFLAWKGIPIVTFQTVYRRLSEGTDLVSAVRCTA